MQRTPRSFIKNVKNATFFYKEPKRTQRTQCFFIRIEKNAKNAVFFYKEWKRMQRMSHSFIKNGKERKNPAFF